MRLMRIILCSALTVATPALAVSAPGTLATSAAPITHGGNRTGCEIDFSAVVADFAYKQGAWVHLTGSLVLNGYGENNTVRPSLTVKLVVSDMASGSGEYKLTPSAPTTVTLIGKGEVSNRGAFIASIAGETPGSLISAFRFDDTFAPVLERILDEGQLVVAFNRREGGLDVRVPIDLRVEDWSAAGAKRSDATQLAFASCSTSLLAEINAKLSK